MASPMAGSTECRGWAQTATDLQTAASEPAASRRALFFFFLKLDPRLHY
jgi:hypothetical protein